MTVYTKWGAHVQFPVVHLLLAATLLVGLAFPVRAADVVNRRSVNEFLVAYFEFPGPSAGGRVIIYIFGNTRGDGAKPLSTAEATYIVDPDGSGNSLLIFNGSAQFPGNSHVSINPSLKRATINAAFVIKDQAQVVSLPVVINAVWTGIGDPITHKTMTHEIGPDYVFNGRVTGGFQFGISSGTITFGSTTYDLSQASYADTLFGLAKEGSVSIVHR